MKAPAATTTTFMRFCHLRMPSGYHTSWSCKCRLRTHYTPLCAPKLSLLTCMALKSHPWLTCSGGRPLHFVTHSLEQMKRVALVTYQHLQNRLADHRFAFRARGLGPLVHLHKACGHHHDSPPKQTPTAAMKNCEYSGDENVLCNL